MCWTVQSVLDSAESAGQYSVCWTVQCVLDSIECAGQYSVCWTVQCVLDSTVCAGQYSVCWTVQCALDALSSLGKDSRALFPCVLMAFTAWLQTWGRTKTSAATLRKKTSHNTHTCQPHKCHPPTIHTTISHPPTI